MYPGIMRRAIECAKHDKTKPNLSWSILILKSKRPLVPPLAFLVFAF